MSIFKVVVKKRSADCLSVELLDGSIETVSPFTISSNLVNQAVKPESKYADALDYSSDESNSADSSEYEVRIVLLFFYNTSISARPSSNPIQYFLFVNIVKQ